MKNSIILITFLLTSCVFNFGSQKGFIFYKNNCSYEIEIYGEGESRKILSLEPGEEEGFIYFIEAESELKLNNLFFLKNGSKHKLYIDDYNKYSYKVIACHNDEDK